MNSPCPTHIDCEGIDAPVVNFSSELPDILYFSSATYNDFNPYQPPPLDPPSPDDPKGPYYEATDCFGVVYSAASQEEADFLAQQASVNCNKSENDRVCYNNQVAASVKCEDGSTFTYVVAAGSFASAYNQSFSVCQSRANAFALAYAKARASMNRTCISDLIEELCIDTVLKQTLTVSGSHPPYTFSVSAGALPASVSLTTTGSKTATIGDDWSQAGTFDFTIRATGADGNYVEKSYSISVFGITNTALVDGTVGTAYNSQLVTGGGTAPILFVLVGTLPPGLVLDPSTGVISGTPTTSGTYHFSVQIISS